MDDSTADLVSPCNCKGMLKWCHLGCLMIWFRRKPNWECEVYESQYTESVHIKLMSVLRLHIAWFSSHPFADFQLDAVGRTRRGRLLCDGGHKKSQERTPTQRQSPVSEIEWPERTEQ